MKTAAFLVIYITYCVQMLAMKAADEGSSRVILANDPDADRLAVAEKQQDGKWKVFTGNELGRCASRITYGPLCARLISPHPSCRHNGITKNNEDFLRPLKEI